MKCRRKEIFEYCPVEHILKAEPQNNPTFKGIPEWVHEAFRDGALAIKRSNIGERLTVLHVRPYGAVPTSAYIIRIGERIAWEPDFNFKLMYEIID